MIAKHRQFYVLSTAMLHLAIFVWFGLAELQKTNSIFDFDEPLSKLDSLD